MSIEQLELMERMVSLLEGITDTLGRIEAKLGEPPKVEVKKRPAHLRSVRLDDERIET